MQLRCISPRCPGHRRLGRLRHAARLASPALMQAYVSCFLFPVLSEDAAFSSKACLALLPAFCWLLMQPVEQPVEHRFLTRIGLFWCWEQSLPVKHPTCLPADCLAPGLHTFLFAIALRRRHRLPLLPRWARGLAHTRGSKHVRVLTWRAGAGHQIHLCVYPAEDPLLPVPLPLLLLAGS